METADKSLSVQDDCATVCSSNRSWRRRSGSEHGWTKLVGVLLLLVAVICFQAYEHVRLNQLEQRQCATAVTHHDDDDDDEVRWRHCHCR